MLTFDIMVPLEMWKFALEDFCVFKLFASRPQGSGTSKTYRIRQIVLLIDLRVWAKVRLSLGQRDVRTNGSAVESAGLRKTLLDLCCSKYLSS